MVTKLEKAKVELIISHPFYASLMFNAEFIEDKNTPTLCVNHKGRVRYNPDFIEQHTVENIVYFLAHELMHTVFLHIVRLEGRDPEKWNYAGDAVINDLLDIERVGKRIPGLVDIPGSSEMSTDQVYNLLQEDTKMDPNWCDLEKEGNFTEEEKKKIEEEVRVNVNKAMNAAKAQGKLSGELERFIRKLLNITTPWEDILERYMTEYSSQEYSWKRPNRRFEEEYLPSLAKRPSMGELVLVIDVSGSISKDELQYYNSHMQRITSQTRPTKVHVLYIDTEVQKHVVFEQDAEVMLEYTSGGGTDICEAWEFLEDEGIFPQVAVVLTDGDTDFHSEPDFPTVWCISNEQINAHYGQTIHFKMEE